MISKTIILATLGLLAVNLCLAAVDKEKELKEMISVAEKCRADVGAAPSDLEELKNHASASTKEGKCMRACVMKHYKLMDADGKFNKAQATEYAKHMADGDAGKEKVGMAIVETCGALALPDDDCEAAGEICKCMKETATKHGMPDFNM